MRRWLWHKAWSYFSHDERTKMCRNRGRHMASWMGIKMIHAGGGCCAWCANGVFSKDYQECITSEIEV